jgi:hypothetical protein
MKPEDLIANLKARATAPPSRHNELLVRHLRCKESLGLSDAVTNALVRYHSNEVRVLPAPTEILPPRWSDKKQRENIGVISAGDLISMSACGLHKARLVGVCTQRSTVQ